MHGATIKILLYIVYRTLFTETKNTKRNLMVKGVPCVT